MGPKLRCGGVRGRQVALDQCVRERPLRAGQLHPVALEPVGVGAALAQLLTLGGEPGDLLQEDLDAGTRVPTPEARRNSRPQNRAHLRCHHRHATAKVEPWLGRIRKNTVKPFTAPRIPSRPVEEVGIEVSSSGAGQPDALALILPEEDSAPRSDDAQLGERLRQLADDGELKGELGKTTVLHADGSSGARRVVVAGVGKRAEVDSDAIRTAASAVGRRLRDVGGTLAWTLDESLPLSFEEQARAVVEGAVRGSYSPARWKTDEKPKKRIERIVLYGGENG